MKEPSNRLIAAGIVGIVLFYVFLNKIQKTNAEKKCKKEYEGDGTTNIKMPYYAFREQFCKLG